MKKLLALAILSMSAAAFVPAVEAKSSNVIANTVNEPQIRIQIGPNRRRNNVRRVVTQTRNVRVGRQLYRETYRVVYRPNGTTRTQLISRVRIGRY
jgi:Flp pilus assembly protein CpaB